MKRLATLWIVLLLIVGLFATPLMACAGRSPGIYTGTISAGEVITYDWDDMPEDIVDYYFVPKYSGTYEYSVDICFCTPTSETKVYILDEVYTLLYSASNTELVSITADLTAGETYVLRMIRGSGQMFEYGSITITEAFHSISLNEAKPVRVSAKKRLVEYEFTPTEDGTYEFYSQRKEGYAYYDTYGYIVDENGIALYVDDDSGGEKQFCVVGDLLAGRTYTLCSRLYDDSVTGTFDVNIVSYEQLTLEQQKPVMITEAGQYKDFTFIPDQSGLYEYEIIQTKTPGNKVIGSVFNEANKLLYRHDGDTQWGIIMDLEAGETYTLRSAFGDTSKTGDYAMRVNRVQELEEGIEHELNESKHTKYTFTSSVNGLYRVSVVYTSSGDEEYLSNLIVNELPDGKQNCYSGKKINISCKAGKTYVLNLNEEYPYHPYSPYVLCIDPLCQEGHTYSGPCDASCDECGKIRQAPHKFTDACDRECNLCHTTRKAPHVYSYSCDDECNGCGAARVASHSYKTTITKSTMAKNGKKVTKCVICDTTTSSVPIYRPYSFKLSATSYTYNGQVRVPTITIKDSAGKVISSSNYTVSRVTGCKNAGTHKVLVKMKGNYTGSKELSFKINPISITKCSIKVSNFTYTGKSKVPTVTVKNAKGTKLSNGTHYTVSRVTGCKTVGSHKVTIKMKGNYSGSKTVSFKINPISIAKCSIKVSDVTYTGKTKVPTVTVKNAKGTKLSKGTHYTVSRVTGCKTIGTHKVTIKMKGNYGGSKTMTFKILPPKTVVTKIGITKRSAKITVKKLTATKASGYQIQHSASSKFTNATTKTLSGYSKTSSTITLPKTKRTYYVRVRTYKTVNGKKYYSGWNTYKYKKTV